jgi:sialate O-acetylesterase
MSFTLSPVFTDHMVLQRDLPIRLSGTAAPGASVTARFGKAETVCSANQAGDWNLQLPPMPASGEPGELIVTASGTEKTEAEITLRDILVGEVWVCSGQSNMEWPLNLSNDAEAEIVAADFPKIRLFTVSRRIAMKPAADIPNARWERCSPQTIPNFSAVGYFFGRELHRRLGIPIGLIHSSWGGTPAESWVSADGLLNEPRLATLHPAVDFDSAQSLAFQTEYRRKTEELQARTSDAPNTGLSRGWAEIAEPTGEWNDMRLPTTWQSHGLKFSGVLWFRKTVDLPASWAGKDLELAIGSTDKSDVTYFNGTQVGSVTMKDRPDSWSFRRVYTVPGKLVKPGRNVIAVRVHSDLYDGGMRGPAADMYIRCPGDPAGSKIPLADVWRYAIEKNFGLVTPLTPPPGPDNPGTPTVLFNGMIHPLLPLQIRGAIWYQGESNADRHEQYRVLFQTLIKNWRQKWQRDDLAFHFVQLANYMARRDEPTDTNWARLREAQALALQIPHTGMAVAIDIGDAADIHPRNKQDVGKRLAHSALHRTYKLNDVVPCGPQFREFRVAAAQARVSFDYAESGLVSHGDRLLGFALAGEDRRFHWADATIDGQTVVLSSPAVRSPVAVRYAWADNPAANLYNTAGLPGVPFRTDTWSTAP